MLIPAEFKETGPIALALCLLPGVALADEGMWTFDDFPAAKVEKAYGRAPDAAWLDHMQRASLKLGNGCSASFVSKRGLILTNHHCARACVEQLSTGRRNLIEQGFYARRARDERRCPGLEVSRLEAIEDVTARVKDATADKAGEAFEKAERAVIADLEKACATGDETRCDVVRLYNGARFHLYRYRRFEDVRLVFVPEDAIAAFGGDPDNFEFPRYCLDMALLRAYDGGRPAEVEHHLEWASARPKAGDVTYVSGHPGRTQRNKTIAQLTVQRDRKLPDRVTSHAERKGLLSEFVTHGRENARTGSAPLFRIQNAFKVYSGRRDALLEEAFFAQLVVAEMDLRRAVLTDDDLKASADAWPKIAEAVDEAEKRRVEAEIKEHHGGFGSKLFGYAWTLVRATQERAKPNGERLPEYADARLPRVEAELFAKRPVHVDLERAMLRWGLSDARARLGPDDPFVRKLLAGRAPAAQANRLVRQTRLASASVRKKLYEAGWGAVSKSKDPLIQLVLSVESDGRAVRAWYEAEVEPIIKKNESKIADARFAVSGTTVYPDATGTLRLSFGQVEGFEHAGQTVKPFTHVKGLAARATGAPPFRLPERWREAIGRLPEDLPVNLTTTNDIIGGNSGSPLVNADGELIGLVFDGNRYALGGAYGFDPARNRAVSVHAAFLRAALEDVYRAKRVVVELGF